MLQVEPYCLIVSSIETFNEQNLKSNYSRNEMEISKRTLVICIYIMRSIPKNGINSITFHQPSMFAQSLHCGLSNHHQHFMNYYNFIITIFNMNCYSSHSHSQHNNYSLSMSIILILIIYLFSDLYIARMRRCRSSLN